MTATLASDLLDPATFRRVLGHYPSGVAAITSTGPDGAPVGLVVSSFTSVSLDPPLVAWFPDKRSSTWPAVRERGSFVVNVLGADQEAVCRSLAAKGGDKFAGVAWAPDDAGLPLLDGAVAWIGCDLEAVHDAGDHEIVVGRVRRLAVDGDVAPLLFFRGGYGRFADPSLAAIGDPDVVEHLRLVETLRTALVATSLELGVEVLVHGVAGSELIILASSGHPDPARLATPVGERLPLVPPIGAGVAAFSDPAGWLARGDAPGLAETLAAIRERGWSAALEGHEAVGIPSAERFPLRSVTVPVLEPDGTTRLALTAYGLPEESTRADLGRYVDALLGLAAAGR